MTVDEAEVLLKEYFTKNKDGKGGGYARRVLLQHINEYGVIKERAAAELSWDACDDYSGEVLDYLQNGEAKPTSPDKKTYLLKYK